MIKGQKGPLYSEGLYWQEEQRSSAMKITNIVYRVCLPFFLSPNNWWITSLKEGTPGHLPLLSCCPSAQATCKVCEMTCCGPGLSLEGWWLWHRHGTQARLFHKCSVAWATAGPGAWLQPETCHQW